MTGSADRRPVLSGLLALGAAAVLLAGVPAFVREQVFTTGFALRAVVFALLSAGALFAAWAGPGTRPALGVGRGALLGLPLLVALLGLPAFDGTWAGAARHGYTWVLLALWPLALLWVWRTDAEPAQLLRWIVGAGAIAALLSLLPVLRGEPAIGPFGRAGVAGPVFGALVVPAIFFSPLRHRIARWAPACVLLLACVLTRSRTGMVAVAIALPLALAIGLPEAALRRRLRLLTAAVVVGVSLLGLLLASGSGSLTLDVRFGLHRASVAAIGERPLRGHGLGAYPVQAIQHRDLEEARLDPRRRPFHAHLDYLHASVEGGVPAGLLLLVFVGGLGFLALRGSGPRRQRAAATGLIATLGIAALGDGVLVDPAPAFLLGCAAAVVLFQRRRGPRSAGILPQLPLVLGAFLALALAFVLARDALADRELMRYRHAIAGDVSPQQAERAARQHLQQGALVWRPDHPEALYRLGVHEATGLRYEAARTTFRAALRADPAMTEARLDLAQVYELEGRPDDARAVLQEALRRDPTRYAVARRMQALALGPEPVPGDALVGVDEIEVLRWMNAARALAPDRFENQLDEARFERRRATDASGLARAGELVRQARAKAPDPEDLPAEVLIESFRLAEVEGKASDLFKASILLGALLKNPRPARRFEAEAERFLREGAQREAAALEAAEGVAANADMRSADRAYRAAAIRFTALLYADRLDAVVFLARARADKELERWRPALARYRSLLAWALPPQRGAQTLAELSGPTRLQALAYQGDLLLEAASVAYHTDKLLAAFYRTRGQLRIGIELLEKRQPVMAALRLKSALETDPNLADAHYGLARARAQQQQDAEAEAALLEALRLKPELKGPALGEPDLAAIRKRTAVRTRLGLP